LHKRIVIEVGIEPAAERSVHGFDVFEDVGDFVERAFKAFYLALEFAPFFELRGDSFEEFHGMRAMRMAIVPAAMIAAMTGQYHREQ
jgi:hypothetical protein